MDVKALLKVPAKMDSSTAHRYGGVIKTKLAIVSEGALHLMRDQLDEIDELAIMYSIG